MFTRPDQPTGMPWERLSVGITLFASCRLQLQLVWRVLPTGFSTKCIHILHYYRTYVSIVDARTLTAIN